MVKQKMHREFKKANHTSIHPLVMQISDKILNLHRS